MIATMTDARIKVENLGKQYRIGGLQRLSTSFRESVANFFQSQKNKFRGFIDGAAPGSGTETFWALRDISFEVGEGEVLGVIGSNGAGKSTLLKILSRITEPTTGRALMNGRIGSLLEVGTGFHGELTGRENIYLSGAILGMKHREIAAKFDEIVEFAGISKFIDTPVKRYSSGMYVRLGFAVAAHLEPEILIIDEVLAVGDAAFQKKCLGKMDEVSKSGRTILFVSHNMAAVRQLCSRCILLREGQIELNGQPDEIIERYLHLAVNHRNFCDLDELDHVRKTLALYVQLFRVEFDIKTRASFAGNDDIPIIITVRGNKTVDNVRFSLVLCQTSGEPIGIVFCPTGCTVADGEKARFRLVLRDLRLAPGQYSICFYVGTGNPQEGYFDLDIAQQALQFEILANEGATKGTMASWRRHWGHMAFPPLPGAEKLDAAT
jgi:lipopolysaccharide transport system ATP-binding protein